MCAQPGVLCAPGWFYSYFAIYMRACPSVQGLGRPEMDQWRSSWHTWPVRLSWFVRLIAAKGSQVMTVVSKVHVEAQLSLHNHNIAKEPQNHRSYVHVVPRNRWLTTNQPRSVIAMCVTLLCVHKQAPSFSRLAAPTRMRQSTSR